MVAMCQLSYVLQKKKKKKEKEKKKKKERKGKRKKRKKVSYRISKLKSRTPHRYWFRHKVKRPVFVAHYSSQVIGFEANLSHSIVIASSGTLGAVHKVQCRQKNEIRLKGGEGVRANVILFVTSGKHWYGSRISMFGKFRFSLEKWSQVSFFGRHWTLWTTPYMMLWNRCLALHRVLDIMQWRGI